MNALAQRSLRLSHSVVLYDGGVGCDALEYAAIQIAMGQNTKCLYWYISQDEQLRN